jgi:DNA polymerase delta subunit 3
MHDAPLSSSSDDDSDAVLALSKPKSTNPKEETARFERLAREARLRKLMEDDDDDGDSAMSDAPPPKAESPEIEDSQPEESQEVEPVAPAGRRRGKRKVLKKKTLKDEEGYLGKSFTVPITGTRGFGERWLIGSSYEGGS